MAVAGALDIDADTDTIKSKTHVSTRSSLLQNVETFAIPRAREISLTRSL